MAGIKKLDLHALGDGGGKVLEASGIQAPDDEFLPFSGPVLVAGQAEEWLVRVEEAMFATVRLHLYKVRLPRLFEGTSIMNFSGNCRCLLPD